MSFSTFERTEAYRFFAIAFGAAPGVTHFRDIALAYENGAPTKQIVNEYTKKAAFKSVFPDALSNSEFALSLVESVVGNSASAQAKNEAAVDIVLALLGGASRGDVIYQIFTNLSNLRGDAKWGSLAAKLDAQVAVSRYYTEVVLGPSADPTTLRAVLNGVDGTTDVSDAALALRFTAAPVQTAVSGRVIDGYVAGATVFVDYNNNGIADTEQERGTLTTTDSSGRYTLNSSAKGGVIVASGGVNIDTGNANTLVLKAPLTVDNTSGVVGANLTPLTTLITTIAASSSTSGLGLTSEDLTAAETKVKQALGLTNVTASILQLDPVAVAASATASAGEKSAALQVFSVGVAVALISAAAQSSATSAAEKAAASAAVFSALATQVAKATVPTGSTAPVIDLTKVETVTQVFQAARVEVAAAAVTNAVQTVSQVVTATSTAAISSTQNQFEDRVNPVNAPPFFSTSTATASVAEGSLIVGTFTASDQGGTLTYSLSGTDANRFDIVAGTGAVTFKSAPDFETGPRSLLVRVVATDSGGLSSTLPVRVNLTDVNEAPTAVALSNQTTALAENTSTASRIKVADIAITDDALGTNAVTLSGADAASFEVDGAALYLKAGTTLNFEAKASYAVTVSVADAALTGSTPVTASYTLSVTNLDDNAPTITSSSTASSIAENSGAGQVVYTATSTDSDVVSGNTVYSLKPNTGDGSAFSINQTTGAVTLTADPDFETKSGYTFTVVATDAANNSSEKAVSLSITDVVEGPVPTSGNDTLTYTSASEAIDGLAGNDTINGGGGSDTITGGLGVDMITLGAGNSRIVLAAGHTGAWNFGTPTNNVAISVAQLDVVTGFNPGDTLVLPFGGQDPTGISDTASGRVIQLISGTYSSGNFTPSSGGPDLIVVYDNNGDATGVTLEAVVLVGAAQNGGVTGATGGTGGTGVTGVVGG